MASELSRGDFGASTTLVDAPAADLWVQCDECGKWRKLPPGTSIDDNSSWFCRLHPDPRQASCSIPEEPAVVEPAPADIKPPLLRKSLLPLFTPPAQQVKVGRGRRVKAEAPKPARGRKRKAGSVHSDTPPSQPLAAHAVTVDVEGILGANDKPLALTSLSNLLDAIVAGMSAKDEKPGGVLLPPVGADVLQIIKRADGEAADMLVKALDLASADVHFCPGVPQSQVLLGAIAACVLAVERADPDQSS